MQAAQARLNHLRSFDAHDEWLTASARARKIAAKTPIILLTMYGNSLKQDEASAIGVDSVLSKTQLLSDFIEKAHASLKAKPSDLAQGAPE
jgi:hypothetical protein